MQPHRRFDLLLEAFRRAAAASNSTPLRLVVLGRGTHAEEVARAPARALGIDSLVRFPGYIMGERYLGALAAFDAAILLVQGSDGTCRAIREAQAMGRPAIVSRRGILPEIVRDGETGIVVDEDPDSLAQAMLRLAGDPALCARLGRTARDRAHSSAIERVGEALRVVYETIISRSA
jgi:glycosyltransferase involved in cell wall biosynthesis